MSASTRRTTMNKRSRRVAALSAAAFAVLTAGGCDRGLTDVNLNPNAPETVPVENLLLGGIWDVTANQGNRGVFGDWTQLYHSANWVQHFAQPVYNEEDVYTPRGSIVEALWSEMYFALIDLDAAKKLADGVNDNIWAIAEIMTVYGFMVLTDYYGDIPYSEALRLEEGITAPVYDAQSVIYPDLIARLITAGGRIDVGETTLFDAFDPVYQGDMDGWLMFANSLRLRLAMRMVNAAPAAAQSAFEAAWASQIFTGVTEHADVDWLSAQPAANPIYEGIVLAGRPNDWRLSESFIDRLVAFSDPRLPIYAEPAVNDLPAIVYRGERNGRVPSAYLPPRTVADFSTVGTFFITPSSPSDLMSYAEVLLLGAEAAELGWAVGAAADVLYQDGITASMEQYGIASADITTYLAQPALAYATGTYAGLDAIHVQKWLALFLAGPEVFSEMRRVGWDWTTDAATTGLDLVPAEGSVLGAGEFPQRLYLPPNEQLTNPDNYPASPPTLTDPVWWAN
jgi:hypothetical protein